MHCGLVDTSVPSDNVAGSMASGGARAPQAKVGRHRHEVSCRTRQHAWHNQLSYVLK